MNTRSNYQILQFDPIAIKSIRQVFDCRSHDNQKCEEIMLNHCFYYTLGILMNTLINQTQSIIEREINEILETYPHHPYQQIFAHPDRRQELVAYVLNRVPSLYTSVDITSPEFTLASPTAILVDVETTIHRGVSQLLRGQSFEQEIPSIKDSSRMASNWFG